METNLPVVSEKDTKKVLLSAYERALEVIKNLQAGVMDPVKEVAEKREAATVAKAEEIVKSDLSTAINSLLGSVDKTLTTLTTTIEEAEGKYNSITEAIAVKEKELEEMFAIEKSAFTLAALINAHKNEMAEHDEKLAFKLGVAQADLDELNKTIKEANEKLQANIKEANEKLEADIKAKKAEAELTRKREEEQFVYDRDRKRKLENDEWTDKKGKREKELADKEQDYKTRLNGIVERETKVDALEAKVAEIPSLLDTKFKEGKDEGKKEAGISHKFETDYLKKQQEIEIKVLNNKIEMLETSVKNKDIEIKELKEKLEAANTRNSEMAAKVIEGSGKDMVIASLQKAMSDNKTSTK
jgi:chromosome segregation ATPase